MPQGQLAAAALAAVLLAESPGALAQSASPAPAPSPSASPADPSGPAPSSFAWPDQGKLLATGGVSSVEGSGGGGLATWALISGYGSRDSYGGNLHYTVLSTQDYQLDTTGLALGVGDRVELSFANEHFRATDKLLSGTSISEDVVGLKVRVAGDAVYAQDSWLPQIALGLQYKDNRGISGLAALGIREPTDLGAKHNQGVDYLVSATKLMLAQSLLVDATVRLTEANQFGLLGFGGDRNSGYKAEFEGSIAYLINRKLAAGVEYRSKPHNLSVDDEGDAYDAFIAWFPTRNVSVTAAYVELGTILKPFNTTRQHGPYLSLQVGF
jgi:hypothetical protein